MANTSERILSMLDGHRLRKTNFRQTVLEQFLLASPRALSRLEIEKTLEDNRKVDRVTLYRTLKSFEDAGLIHVAMDSSGEQKYALCSEECTTHQHEDLHAHFYCKTCEQTTCLDEVNIPRIEVPSAYQLEETQVVLSGVCKDCR